MCPTRVRIFRTLVPLLLCLLVTLPAMAAEDATDTASAYREVLLQESGAADATPATQRTLRLLRSISQRTVDEGFIARLLNALPTFSKLREGALLPAQTPAADMSMMATPTPAPADVTPTVALLEPVITPVPPLTPTQAVPVLSFGAPADDPGFSASAILDITDQPGMALAPTSDPAALTGAVSGILSASSQAQVSAQPPMVEETPETPALPADDPLAGGFVDVSSDGDITNQQSDFSTYDALMAEGAQTEGRYVAGSVAAWTIYDVAAGSVQIAWMGPADGTIDQYVVQRRNEGGEYTLLGDPIAATDGIPHENPAFMTYTFVDDVTALADGATYAYEVLIDDGSLEYPYVEAKPDVTVKLVPEGPSFSGTATYDRSKDLVTVLWTTSTRDDVREYRVIRRATAGSMDFTPLSGPIETTGEGDETTYFFYDDVYASPDGTVYSYGVEALDAAGEVLETLSIEPEVVVTRPSEYGAFDTDATQAAIAESSVTLYWSAVQDPKGGYGLSYRKGSGNFNTVLAIEPTKQAGVYRYTFDGLTPFTTYEFALVAKHTQDSTFSGAFDDTILVRTLPAAVTDAAAVPTEGESGSLTLTWAIPGGSAAEGEAPENLAFRVIRKADGEVFDPVYSGMVDAAAPPLTEAAYEIYAYAADDPATVSPAAEVSGTAALAGPEMVTATLDGQALRIRWDAVPGATRHRVEYRAKAAKDWTPLGVTADAASQMSITINDTMMPSGDAYAFRVTAGIVPEGSDQPLFSELSTESAEPLVIPLGAPESVTVTTDHAAASYRIEFDAVKNATGYIITREGGGFTQVVGQEETGVTDAKAPYLTPARYQVIAIKGSEESAPAVGETDDVLTPPAPENVTAEWSPEEGGIAVSFDAYVPLREGRVDAVVVRTTGSDGSHTDVYIERPTDTRTVFEPLGKSIVAGGTYEFAVAAMSGGQLGAEAPLVSATVPSAVMPEFLRAEAVSPTEIAIEWSHVGLTPTSVLLRMQREGDDEWTELDPSQTAYGDLTPFTRYTFEITSTFETGESMTADVTLRTLPAAPENLRAEPTALGALTVSWEYPGGETPLGVSYHLERESQGESTQVVIDPAASPLEDTAVLPLFETTYTLYAYDRESGQRNPDTVTLEAPAIASLGAPETASAQLLSHGGILLTWDEVPGANAYEVRYRQKGDKEYAPIEVTGERNYEVPATMLVAGETYEFQIAAAIRAGGETRIEPDYAAEVSIAYPGLPQNVTAEYAGDDVVQITFSMPGDEGGRKGPGSDGGYTVFYRQEDAADGAFLSEIMPDRGSRSIPVRGIRENVRYAFYVVPGIGPMPSDVEAFPSASILLTAPELTAATIASLSEVETHWTFPEDILPEGFAVLMGSGEGDFDVIGQVDPAERGAIITLEAPMANASRYEIRVAALYAGKIGPSSNGLTIVTGPVAPTDVTATADDDSGSVVIDWSEAPAATGYRVYRRLEAEAAPGEEIAETGETTYTDYDAEAGRAYLYSVLSYSGAETNATLGGLTEAAPVRLDMGRVQVVTADGTLPGVMGIQLRWGALSGVPKYNVYAHAEGDARLVGDGVTENALLVTPGMLGEEAAYGQAYTFTVHPVSADGYEGDASDPSQEARLLMAVTDVSAAALSDHSAIVRFAVDAPPPEGFTLFRSLDEDFLRIDAAYTLGAGETAFEDDGLDAGVTYYYRLQAEPALGDAPFGKLSMAASATPSADILPPPTGLVAEEAAREAEEDHRIALSWADSENAEGYVLRRHDAHAGRTVELAQIASGVTAYTDSDVVPGIAYTYALTAYRTVGGARVESDRAEARVQLLVGSVEPLEILPDETRAESGLLARWTAAPGADRYALAVSETTAIADSDIRLTVTGTRFTITPMSVPGLEYGKTYYFAIYPVYDTKDGPFRAPRPSMARSGKLLLVPTDVTATGTGPTTIDIAWTADANPPSGFLITRADSPGGAYERCGKVGGAERTFTDNRRREGTTYYYRVTALPEEKFGQESAITPGTTAGGAAPAPTLASGPELSAAPTSVSAVTLRWTAAEGAIAYNVERTETPGSGYTLLEKAEGTQYVDETALPNVQYYYRVTPVLEKGRGIPSQSQMAFIPLSLAGQATFERVDGGSVALSWDASGAPLATHIGIDRAEAGGEFVRIATLAGTMQRTADGQSETVLPTSHTDGGLDAGTAYTYRVTPLYMSGTDQHEGLPAELSVPAVQGADAMTPAGVRGTTAHQTGFDTVTLSWAELSTATGYRISRSRDGGETYEAIADVPAGTVRYADGEAMPALGQPTYRIAPLATGEGAGEGEASAPFGPAAPTAPLTGLMITEEMDGLGIILSWDAEASATEYHIYQYPAQEAAPVRLGIAYGVGNTSFFVEGALPDDGGRYFTVALRRPGHEGDETYQLAGLRRAALTDLGPGGLLLEYETQGGDIASASFSAAPGGIAIVGLSHDAARDTLLLDGIPEGTESQLIPLWPMAGHDLLEEVQLLAVSDVVAAE